MSRQELIEYCSKHYYTSYLEALNNDQLNHIYKMLEKMGNNFFKLN